jgi:hypothetical protein
MSDVVTPFVQFYDRVTSAVDATDPYSIIVSQSIEGVDTGGYFQQTTQPFHVRAPQFFLDASWIHAQFPPPDSTGHFDENLPHIALDTPILPWERHLIEGDETTPWLAVLVFRGGELDVDPVTGSTLTESTVDDLLTPSTTIVNPAIDKASVPADVLASPCRSIIVPGALFQSVAPMQADLPYLAHVRQVDRSAQPVTEGPTDDGWYTVVVANRFPSQTGGRHGAYLVSLESFAQYLVPGAKLPTLDNGDPQPVQLAVLASWNFISQPAPAESFADLVQAIVTGERADPTGRESLLLRIPPPATPAVPTPAQTEAVDRLTNGYAPLPYGTEFGDQTFAWFRGPLAPVVPPPVPKPEGRFTSASQALVYVQPDGVFDVSYAAAWNTGRALALADAGFSSAILRFRRASRGLVTSLLQRMPPDLTTPPDLAALVAAAPVRAAFDALLAKDLAGSLAAAVAAPPPSEPPPPPEATDPGSPVAALQALLAAPDAQSTLAEELSDELEPLAQWLAQLMLLRGVPFANLVPEERMLPPESLRFFYVDPGWTGGLADGALSVGVEGVLDATVGGLLAGVLDDAVADEVLAYRRRLAGTASPPGEADLGAPLSGLLLRSALVSGWPSLVITASQGGTALELVRFEALSPDTMIALFLGVPDTVTIQEPQQGLQFGVEDKAGGGHEFVLRRLTAPVGQATGQAVPFSDAFLRGSPDLGVLTLQDGTTTCLVAQLETALGPSPIGPADVALQLVKGAEQQQFTEATT